MRSMRTSPRVSAFFLLGIATACGETPPAASPVASTFAVASASAAAPAPTHAPWKAGASCADSGKYTCAADHATALLCDAGTVREVPCHGPRGCARATDGEDKCDDDLAVLGEPCVPHTEEQGYACSTDAKSGLQCKNGTFELWRRC